MNLLRKSYLMLLVVLFCSASALHAQLRTKSVGLDMERQNLSSDKVEEFLLSNFGGNGLFSFEKVREYDDEYGMTHADYQQKHNEIELEGCMIIVHSFGTSVVSLNGQAAMADQMTANQKSSLSADRAVSIAKQQLRVNSNVSPKAHKLYARCIDENGDEVYKLVYRTRVTSIADLTDMNIYIDAKNGDVLKQVDMIQYAGEVVEKKLPTYYSGEQIIRMEKGTDGNYILVDKDRQNFTLQGKANTKITSADLQGAVDENDHDKFDSLLIAHIDYMTKNTPAVENKSADDWDFFIIDHAEFLKYVAMPELNASELNYEIQFKHNGKRVGGSFFPHNYATPPIIEDYHIDIMRDSVYTCEVVHNKYIGNIFEQYRDSVIYSFEFKADKDGKIEFPNKDFEGSINIKRKHNHALDVHYAIDQCYQYYLNVHNRKSFDGKNSPIYQFVDFDDGGVFPNFTRVTTNAFAWATEPYFIATGIGDGNYSISDKFTSFDLLAHEFNHLVTSTNGRGGIGTTGESGALNEAIADCFGVATDFYANPKTANWQIADSVMLDSPYMRDLSDPNLKDGTINGYMTHPQADTYGGKNWKDPNNLNMDNGGVHYNNGVFNYWFYLLTEGGSGINDNNQSYEVEGIGIKNTEKLLMNVVMNYITREVRFSDMCIATRLAAKSMFGANSNEYAQVNNAWYAVGVNETTDVEHVEGTEQLVVYSLNNQVMVETEEGRTIDIYSAAGQLIASAKSQQGVTVIPMPEGMNVVIVRVGTLAEKLIIK